MVSFVESTDGCHVGTCAHATRDESPCVVLLIEKQGASMHCLLDGDAALSLSRALAESGGQAKQCAEMLADREG